MPSGGHRASSHCAARDGFAVYRFLIGRVSKFLIPKKRSQHIGGRKVSDIFSCPSMN